MDIFNFESALEIPQLKNPCAVNITLRRCFDVEGTLPKRNVPAG